MYLALLVRALFIEFGLYGAVIGRDTPNNPTISDGVGCELTGLQLSNLCLRC